MPAEQNHTISRQGKFLRLAPSLADDEFRNSYFSRKVKLFLAAQIKALRGKTTQVNFGREVGKPQSVVSRLEKQNVSGVNIQTLIDIAKAKKVGLLIRFVPFDEFLRYTENFSEEAISPPPFGSWMLNAVSPPQATTSAYRNYKGSNILRFGEYTSASGTEEGKIVIIEPPYIAA